MGTPVAPDTQSIAIPLPIEAADTHVRRQRGIRAKILCGLFLADLLAIISAFSLANFIVYGREDVGQALTLLSACVPLFIVFGLHDGAYGPHTGLDIRTSMYRVLKSLTLTAAALMLFAFMLKVGAQFSRAQFVIGTGLAAVLLVIFRFVVGRLCAPMAKNGLFAVVHIYDDSNSYISMKEGGRFSISAQEAGLKPDLGDSIAINRLGTIARGMDSVVVHCAPNVRQRWANILRTLDVPSELVVPELNGINGLKLTRRGSQTAIVLSDGRLSWDKALLKRIFDLALVTPMIPILLITFAVLGVLVKLDSAGPVFFRQERIGVGNRPFRIWKFRSMKSTGQDDAANTLTQRNDSRVTRVGAFMRKTSIDELPQLINVLLGDMSLVGPRPHAAMARAGNLLYWEVDPSYWERHAVKPGITGLAQIRGFRGNTFEEENLRERLQADLEYVASWSLLMDVRILTATLFLVPFHKNAF